jgi:hypothetical protein
VFADILRRDMSGWAKANARKISIVAGQACGSGMCWMW